MITSQHLSSTEAMDILGDILDDIGELGNMATSESEARLELIEDLKQKKAALEEQRAEKEAAIVKYTMRWFPICKRVSKRKDRISRRRKGK